MTKTEKVSPHRSFRRTYREEWQDDFEAPSFLTHAGETFALIFKNWKLFLPVVSLAVLIIILFVGLLSQSSIDTARTTILENSDSFTSRGDLGSFATAALLLLSTISTGGLSDGSLFILVVLFLIIFLISTHIARLRLSGKKVDLRSALFSSMTPLLSTLTIVILILAELIPIFIVIIFTSAAVKTGFLATPFYALLFAAFATAMILLSGYLLSHSVLALVATSAPGVYPGTALSTTRDIVFGRRLRFIFRLIFLVFVVAFIYVIIMLPVILIDTAMKSAFDFLANVPVISFFLLFSTCFVFVYISIYLYLFYRRLLDYEPKERKKHE